MKMENIKMYEEFDQIQWDDELKVPRSVIEGWIRSIEAQEDSINETIFAREEMEKFLDEYYDNQIEPSDPEEFAKKHTEDIEPEDITGAAADEDPTLIKKFEE